MSYIDEIPEREYSVYGGKQKHVMFMQFHDYEHDCTHAIYINYNKDKDEYERHDCLDTKGELEDPISNGFKIMHLGTFNECLKYMVMNLLILKGDL